MHQMQMSVTFRDGQMVLSGARTLLSDGIRRFTALHTPELRVTMPCFRIFHRAIWCLASVTRWSYTIDLTLTWIPRIHCLPFGLASTISKRHISKHLVSYCKVHVQTIHGITYIIDSVNKTTEGLGLVAACIGQQIRNIRRAFHGRKVMVFNVPPLQRMPFFAGSDETEKWQNAAETLNEMIRQDVTKLKEQYTDLKLDLVDVYGLLNDVAADPENFGFKDAETAYLDSPPRSSQADNYVWWDRTHLTSGKSASILQIFLWWKPDTQPLN